MRALFLPLPNGMIYEAVTRRIPDAFVATPVTRPRGTYSRLSSSAATAQFNTVFGMPQNGITIVVFCRNTSTSGFDAGAILKVGSPTTGYGIGVGSGVVDSWDTPASAQRLTGLYEAVAWKYPGSVVTVPSTGIEYYCAAMRISANNTGGIYAPGLGEGTWAASTPVAPASNTYIGGYQSGRYPEEHELLAAALFSSILTNADVLSLYNDPWQLFQPSRIYIPQATAAGYTHPTLSVATALEISATSFKPSVTYTFS
jgi:hypothetical protein